MRVPQLLDIFGLSGYGGESWLEPLHHGEFATNPRIVSAHHANDNYNSQSDLPRPSRHHQSHEPRLCLNSPCDEARNRPRATRPHPLCTATPQLSETRRYPHGSGKLHLVIPRLASSVAVIRSLRLVAGLSKCPQKRVRSSIEAVSKTQGAAVSILLCVRLRCTQSPKQVVVRGTRLRRYLLRG